MLITFPVDRERLDHKVQETCRWIDKETWTHWSMSSQRANLKAICMQCKSTRIVINWAAVTHKKKKIQRQMHIRKRKSVFWRSWRMIELWILSFLHERMKDYVVLLCEEITPYRITNCFLPHATSGAILKVSKTSPTFCPGKGINLEQRNADTNTRLRKQWRCKCSKLAQKCIPKHSFDVFH